MSTDARRTWVFTTTWTSAAISAVAVVLLIVFAYTGPRYSITETNFSGMSVFAARLAGAAFMAVLLFSCLLQASIHLPQEIAKRPGPSTAAVLDLLLIVGVFIEVVLVLSVGFDDRPELNDAIVGCGLLIALVSVVRFVVVVMGAIRQMATRRRAHQPH